MSNITRLRERIKKPEGLKKEDDKLFSEAANLMLRSPTLKALPSAHRACWAQGFVNGVLKQRAVVSISVMKVGVLRDMLTNDLDDIDKQSKEEVLEDILNFLKK